MKTQRAVKRAEPLAIMHEAIHSGPKGIWWDVYAGIPDNERCGRVEVVSIRGSLEHHEGCGGDSYDSILERATHAFDGEGNDGPPSFVVLRIDSPGGVVSGLNEAVLSLRRMSVDREIPLIAYVDELAASAAYALACSCEEIYMPPSAITGSVGVISTLYDQVEADKKMGVRFVTLTSGTRKADGHPHVPITDAALNAEQRRVDRLAKQFYRIVSDVRPVSTADVEGMQAGIFLAQEAVTRGLADGVMGWSDLLAMLNDPLLGDATTPNKGKDKFPEEKKKLAMPANAGPSSLAQGGAKSAKESQNMSLAALKALVKSTQASIAAEKDPKKKKLLLAALTPAQAALEAYKKVKHTKETHEEEEAEDEADEESEEESEESEEESEESEAKGNETDRKESKKAESDDGDDDDDDKDEDDDEDEDEAAAAKGAGRSLAALAQQVTGKKGRAAVGALSAMLEQGQRAAAMVDQIARERRAEKKEAAITAALNSRRVTKHEAKTLRGKPLSFVSSFLDMRPKAIINVDDDSIRIPDPNAKAGDGSGLSADIRSSIEVAIASAPDGADKAALRKSLIADHEKRMNAGLNGVGRY